MKSRRHPSEQPFNLFEVDGPSGNRVVRLEHLFFEEVDRLFRLEVSDPRLQVLSIVSLHLSPDLRNAKVNFALDPTAEFVPPEKEIQAGLSKAMPFLRARLAEALSMKRIPTLHFHRDRLAEASLRANEVLKRKELQSPSSQTSESIDPLNTRTARKLET